MKIFSFLLGLLPMLVMAQQVSPDNVSKKWDIIYSTIDVTVYASKTLCDFNQGFDEHSVLLKVENNSATEVSVSWQLDLFYNGTCINCTQLNENKYTYTIAANSSTEGICDRDIVDGLRIFSSFEGYEAKQVLTGFELTNVKTVEK
jgi:hypothetical protein